MTAAAAALWDLLSAAGGTLAFTFIIAIAVGINALTVLFVGSAVVVLERFARAVRRPGPLAAVAAVWIGLLAWNGWRAAAQGEAALLPGEAAPAPGLVAAVVGGAVLLAMALVAVCLRSLRSSRLALASAVLIGTGYAVFVGGAQRPLLAAAPLAVAAGLFLVLRRGRRRSGRDGLASEIERLCGALLPPLAGGLLLALALPEPSRAVSEAGVSLVGVFLWLVLLGLLPLAVAGLLDMRGSAEWFIAVRYLVAKRRQTFISLITLICVGGVAVGVWLIITVLSVMNGFETVWREEIIRNRAHFTVLSGTGPIEDYGTVLEKVGRVPEVVAAAPFLDAEGMVRGERGEIVGVRVRGVDPDLVAGVTDLRADLVRGSLEGLEPLPEGSEADPGIVIGSRLASGLGLDVGDALVLISPFGGPPTPFGPGPRLKRFRVAGVFESTFFQYDESFTYVGLPAAQDFRRVGDVADGVEVRVTDHLRSRQVADRVDRLLGFPYFTRDWKELFPAFFQALKTEQVMMFLLLTMIMVVAAFVIVATLVMMIMEKSGDIAILKAMGARDAAIERIFAIEGTLIGLAGTALGVVAGVAVTTQLAWIQEKIEAITGIDTLPATVYQFSTLPSEIDPVEVIGVVAIAMILSLGATLVPSRQGARLHPAEALRYE